MLRGLVEQGTTLLLTTQVFRGSRSARRQHRGDRQGPHHRRGLAAAAQAAGGLCQPDPHRHQNADNLPAAQALLSKTGAEVFVDAGARQLTAAADGLADMVRVAGWLRDSDIDVDDIGLSRPSLDDVFLSLTGHRTEESDSPSWTAAPERRFFPTGFMRTTLYIGVAGRNERRPDGEAATASPRRRTRSWATPSTRSASKGHPLIVRAYFYRVLSFGLQTLTIPKTRQRLDMVQNRVLKMRRDGCCRGTG